MNFVTFYTGTITYTIVALLAYGNHSEIQSYIDALSNVFCMDKKRTEKLFSDLASVPCVAHVYNRKMQVELNPFYKKKAFENEHSVLESEKYEAYGPTPSINMCRGRFQSYLLAHLFLLTCHSKFLRLCLSPSFLFHFVWQLQGQRACTHAV